VKLQNYLDRINYDGSLEPNFAALAALQQAHVCSVPFENLDVQLGRPLSTRVDEAYEKIVMNLRGGWCYEQNGLFGWALSEIGFDVRRIAASVMREQKGVGSEASHLCLLVRPPGSSTQYLADVGFGGSMITPIALEVAQYDQPPFKLGLDKLNDGYWRFWESLGDGQFTFDFRDAPARESSLTRKCENLQNDPSSSFVLNLTAQRRTRDQHFVLRGRVFTVARLGTTNSKTLDSPEELVSVLTNEFHLAVDGVADLWPRIAARHDELFGFNSSR
jgi:N-hydroxyarylamine O-acetyltransferase